MLLFQTILPIQHSLTKDAFIQLVIEWNQGSQHTENVIPNLIWNGEHNIRFGNDELWLEIQEYRNRNIIAIRYEKVNSDGVIWNTDYVMNFNDMKMCIQLDRSWRQDAVLIDPSFSTPYFVYMLAQKGYLRHDGVFPIESRPIVVTERNLHLLAGVINGNVCCTLPTVYVSKTFYNNDPVEVWDLAWSLKGIAHVLIEESKDLNPVLRKETEDKNDYNGAIGIYYPNRPSLNRRFKYNSYDTKDSILSNKVISYVLKQANSQLIDSLYTWAGVNNALLQDRLIAQRQERIDAENEKDNFIDAFSDDFDKLERQLKEQAKTIESLTYENMGLREKVNSLDLVPVLRFGDEAEYFPGEIKEIILDVLSYEVKNIGKGRRKDVLDDIIKNNGYQKQIKKKKDEVKLKFKGYKTIDSDIKSLLTELGFVISEEGKHYRIRYYDDRRYTMALPKSGSDRREGDNIASQISNLIL